MTPIGQQVCQLPVLVIELALMVMPSTSSTATV